MAMDMNEMRFPTYLPTQVRLANRTTHMFMLLFSALLFIALGIAKVDWVQSTSWPGLDHNGVMGMFIIAVGIFLWVAGTYESIRIEKDEKEFCLEQIKTGYKAAGELEAYKSVTQKLLEKKPVKGGRKR